MCAAREGTPRFPLRDEILQSEIPHGSSSAVLLFKRSLPNVGTARLLALTVEPNRPLSGEPCEGVLSYRDLLWGPHVPVRYSNTLFAGEDREICSYQEAHLSFRGMDAPYFRRGDSNADGTVDISDPISTLHRLFIGGADFQCEDAADANDDGRVDISDPIQTFGFLFRGTYGIPHPGPMRCGADVNEDIFAECVYDPANC